MVHGLGGLTTARICAAAGVSPGLLTYYFRGKEDVLFAMVRLNNRTVSEVVAGRLRLARTRWQRLSAIVEGNFAESIFEPNVANAWLSVCAASATNARYARLQRISYRRLHSNISEALGAGMSRDRRTDIALTIGAMIDGLWLRRASDQTLTAAMATDLVLATASAQLTAEDRARLKAP